MKLQILVTLDLPDDYSGPLPSSSILLIDWLALGILPILLSGEPVYPHQGDQNPDKA